MTAPANTTSSTPWWPRVLGAVALAASFAASAMLALSHVRHWSLPGCGVQSACDAVTSGTWGSLAGWPVAFVGAAYFGAWLVGWVMLMVPRNAPTNLPGGLLWVARIGLAGSLVLLSLLYAEGLWCVYCLVAHAGNILFWGIAETMPRAEEKPSETTGLPQANLSNSSRRTQRRAAVGFLASGLLISLALGIAHDQFRRQNHRQADIALQASLAKVIQVSQMPVELDRQPSEKIFQGRHLRGPHEASIRLVVFTDYQCGFCRELDEHLREAMELGDSVTLSVRHYPLCPDCNPAMQGRQFHPQACRAAWAVEAAGMVGGAQSFWAMHDWLFARHGRFSDAELTAALPSLGIKDPQQFLAAMNGPPARGLVAMDVEQGRELEVKGTPALFVNGVRMQGLDDKQSLLNAVAKLDEAQLPKRSALLDRPPLLGDKVYDAWRSQQPAEMPTGLARWRLGPDDAPLRLVLFSDGMQRESAELLAAARELIERRGDVRLDCYPYPFSKEAFPIARMIEAAGWLGGDKAFWRMHDFHSHLSGFPSGTSVEAGIDSAERFGLDGQKLADLMDLEFIAQTIRDNVQLGVQCKASASPLLYLDGRPIPDVRSLQQIWPRFLAEVAAASGQ